MSQRLREHIQRTLAAGDKLFSVYITAGFPEKAATLPILQALDAAGVDFVELGIPFSDPIADGPTIQAASTRAIENGTTLPWILEQVAQFRRHSQMPIILMGYLNPVLQYGMERFCRDCPQAGVDGVILPDLPFEEAQALMPFFHAADLDNIYLIAPNTPPERIRLLAEHTTAFLYCTAYTGVTGANRAAEQQTTQFFAALREMVDVPYIIGFGIHSAEQVHRYNAVADGVVVGSAFIRFIQQQPLASIPHAVRTFVKGLTQRKQ